MGQLKGDGRATTSGFAVPGATAVVKGDMYRINNWNGIALANVGASDTLRTIDFEIAPDRIWYVKLPAIVAAVGDFLYWTAGAGFKRGDTHLTATPTGSPVCKVEEAIDANGYAAVRVLNVGP